MYYKDVFKPIYDSPIELNFMKNALPSITSSLDSAVLKCVQHYAVGVDEQKLKQALTQDKERYEEAYSRGVLSTKKEGRWKLYDEDDNAWMCDECGDIQTITDGTPHQNGWIFCPHCGALLTTLEWGWEHVDEDDAT